MAAQASSTSEIIFRMLEGRLPMTAAEAAGLYAGLIYDTGGFRHSSTSPETMQIAGALMGYGIPFTEIYNRFFDSRSFSELKLMGRALSNAELLFGGDVVCSQITAAEIAELGGSVRYDAHVVDLDIKNNAVQGVILDGGERLAAGAVVLACGHSARDTYAMLARRGVGIVAKPFAIGVRIEHPQELIDKAQYGSFAGHHMLGAADYALVYHTQDKTRTAYSFCMCPGGQVVAAASEAGGVVVNGMSMFKRDSGIANSALVVNVDSRDFGEGALAGVEFQRRYEQLAYAAAGSSYYAPAQNLDSFLKRSTPSLECMVQPSYRPGLAACSLDKVLPAYVTDTLREGITSFGRKLAGYADGGALLTGVETRTSAPVRIERDRQSYVSLTHDLLYPCGEGAGYAGGIMSAALDGYHVARAIMERFAPVK